MNTVNVAKAVLSAALIGSGVYAARAQENAQENAPQDAQQTQAQPTRPGKVFTDVVRKKAKVVDVDYGKRLLTLKSQSGEVQELVVDPQVRRFNEIKKGDEVVVDYMKSMAVHVVSPGETPPISGSSSYVVANEGKKPSGTLVESEQVTATVEKIDYKSREVTLRGPDGNARTMKVGPEVKRLNEVKKGDHVVVNYTTAVAITVQKAG